MKTGTCCSEDIATAAGVATVPGGDDAPRTFDDRHQRSNIIDRQSRIHSDVDETRGEHGKKICIAAEPGHPRAAAHFLKDSSLRIRTVNLRCHGRENSA